ncbi:4Fe-4S dicluster domain-containing protein [Heliorestis acidaminivorans]|uniref:4Fe-4S dicluster domain-containing protein n=1 Tax=Heliorestis acidaminivorans TaxID=553427 RepID=A0A6I0EPT4_9FIRM|nr:aldo/keto reductase [Heliorestis acidaminivorans]KAB2951281.1 4Fe-4S dicluster domain-containing protein [Heliorestis acidaminivorans]
MLSQRELGHTGIYVSRLCFGSLTLGPLQANLPLQEGADLLRRAFESGVNFIDTAQLYQTYPYIRQALAGYDQPVVIATKSYAYNREDMAKAVEEARRELDRDVIDIFLLHEQESEHTISGHQEALEYLLEAKSRGIIRATGLSTHTIRAVRAATNHPDLEVIHPIINRSGIGIVDGTAEEMVQALAQAYEAGKGIYGMKALGGGHLFGQARIALEWVLQNQHLHAIAVGMQSEEELALNIELFQGQKGNEATWQAVQQKKRRLLIEEWCSGCGNCLAQCPQGVLQIEAEKATVNQEQCILCGYCSSACPDFCIKVV